MEPLISVIVPVYNVEKYLRKCVDSIIAQTYKNLEIILVDDGSPDNCGAICDEYEEKDGRIKVIHKENGGLSSARNAGLDIASGEYIGFIDSDDFISPRMYERLYDAIKRAGADLCKCDFLRFSEGQDMEEAIAEETLAEERVYCGEDVLDAFSNGGVTFVTAVNKLYKKELWNDIRFPYGKLHEDEFVAHRIYDKCMSIVSISDCLYYYLQRSESIMHVYNIRRLDVVEALCERTEYFIASKNYIAAQIALNGMLFAILKAKDKLDFTVKENKRIFLERKKQVKKIAKKLFFKKISNKSRIKILSFCISPSLFKCISDLLKMRREKREPK
ncbi:MAG: glycosyltransferase [Clostridia bacterium]|nr:glycosyltransferase [Clostridia bacterium]